MKKILLSIICFMQIIVVYSQWAQQASNTNNGLFSVWFTNSNTGYIVGNNGTILKTTNGGNYWFPLNSNTAEVLFSVVFTNNNTGFAVGSNGTILKTINSGANWFTQPSGTNLVLTDIFFSSSNIGYIVGGDPSTSGSWAILKTTDGGANWTIIPTGLTGYIMATYFTDDNTGYILVYTSSSGVIYKTTNGGLNWTSQGSASSPLMSVYFTDANTGYAVGGQDAPSHVCIIRKTVNGGTNWTPKTSPTNNELFSVKFIDPNIGYAVGGSPGNNDMILKTTNSGNSWTIQTGGISECLRDVFFVNANIGYAVGYNGFILKTINGGSNTGTDNISGVVYDDINGNGIKDSSDQGIAEHLIRLDPGQLYSTTDNDGRYGFTVSPGTYTVTYVTRDYWNITNSVSSYNVTILNTNDFIDTLDFAVRSKLNVRDMGIFITGSAARVSRPLYYWLNYKNWGTTTINGTIYHQYDPACTYVTSEPPDYSHINNLIQWNYDTIASHEQRVIKSTFQVNGPVGSTINSYCQIIPLIGDTCPKNNFDTIIPIIVASYDPNDKLVYPIGSGVPGYILHGQKLTYTIRFQNTGTDTAFTVIIKDTLDSDMNVETFSLLASSHTVNYSIKGTGTVTFTFNNILLPDSNVNEAESHGFIKYSIEPKQGLADYTEVKNKAYIYFDSNPAVATNEVRNTYVAQIPTSIYEFNSNSNSISIFPNPIVNSATINYQLSIRGNVCLIIFDVTGKEIKTIINQSQIEGEYNIKLDGSKLENGIYFYRFFTENKAETGKLMILR